MYHYLIRQSGVLIGERQFNNPVHKHETIIIDDVEYFVYDVEHKPEHSTLRVNEGKPYVG